ncbi:hypothetical protein FA95DRAFT_1556630 [Auriscalpium vulgare]|uniref:Uncharacterized protein n=1 Tax=Auriscalpium vulgare TaxID=40419 RepID=A0ACB8S164_9AGAM|nr:hypothetical protein FA95DRAFT_1556630 [Auriscalpium vulgare]
MAHRRIDRPTKCNDRPTTSDAPAFCPLPALHRCMHYATTFCFVDSHIHPAHFFYSPSDSPYARLCCSGRENAGRPKHVCFACRRAFKPAFLPGNEYLIKRHENIWIVRPERVRIAEVWEAAAYLHRRGSPEVRQRVDAVYGAYMGSEFSDKGVDDDEYAALTIWEPGMWWQRVRVSCPGCSAPGVRVGNAFRVPKRRDARGWEAARVVVERDKEKGVFRLGREDEEERISEARRVRTKWAWKRVWEAEKRHRLHALGLQ